jgi:hypothetical protein
MNNSALTEKVTVQGIVVGGVWKGLRYMNLEIKNGLIVD